jgi:ArsR family metal-binding transcriptional regulator
MSSKMVDKLIEDYEIRLVEPGCAPGVGRWGTEISLTSDISAVLPYLNAAVWDNTWYDHKNKILICGEQGQRYAFRPYQIRVARVQDPLDARQIASEIVDKVNSIWQERDRITPRFTEKRLPAVIDIFKLLPKTNCKQCGYLTCLAYAADLREGAAKLEDCPPLSKPEYAENRERIANLFVSD